MNEMYPSKWLSKDDVPTPTRAVISRVTREEIKGDNGDELKNTLYFQGDTLKPMILNRGNAETLCLLYGDDSVGWHGRPIEVYVDPSVMFGGKRVGGLRLRAPAGGAAAAGPPLWDVSDGTTVTLKQTAEQVRALLDGLETPGAVRVKPAGAGREAAVAGDLWLAQHQPAAESGAAGGEVIPF